MSTLLQLTIYMAFKICLRYGI